MKKIVAVLLASFAIVASAGEGDGFVWGGPRGWMVFSSEPCTSEEILSMVRPEAKKLLRTGIAQMAVEGAKPVTFCWILDSGVVYAAPEGMDGNIIEIPVGELTPTKRI